MQSLRNRVEVLENKFNQLEQYGRRNNINVSGILDSIGDNELECSIIKIMKAIDIVFKNSKKTIVGFCNRKLSKRAPYNKKKIVSVNTSAVGLVNNTKLFISQSPTD